MLFHHCLGNMSKRKGLSFDEKRTRMLQLFYDRREFFTLKELERIAPEEKGIVSQSVKDVLQTLVDDGLVRSDKIGTTVCYWAFPGENIVATEQRISETHKKIVEGEFKLQKLQEECLKEKVNKEDTEERRTVIKEVEILRQKESELKAQIAKFSDHDPEAIAKMRERAKTYKEATNVWTDNIFAVQGWCKKKFDIREEVLNKQFSIPDDLDYIE